jgi:hypothetical protein
MAVSVAEPTLKERKMSGPRLLENFKLIRRGYLGDAR